MPDYCSYTKHRRIVSTYKDAAGIRKVKKKAKRWMSLKSLMKYYSLKPIISKYIPLHTKCIWGPRYHSG